MIQDVQFLSSKRMLGFGTTELRCVQPVEYLREAGWTASAGCIGDTVPANSRIFVLHRVKLDAVTRRVIRFARLSGAVIVYDTDDLIFEPSDDASGPSREEAEAVRAAMLQTDIVMASTRFLSDRVPVAPVDRLVMRNGLSREFVRVAAASAACGERGGDMVTIGYFSGSNHHDADFSIIEPALLDVMRRFPHVDLVLGGKLRFSPDFHAFGTRFRHERFRPYSEFMSLLGKIDINIVPLDVKSDFANARSELKYIEAGAFGVPTVASPAMAYREAITSGVNGILCADDGWHEVLSGLVQNGQARLALGEAACRDVHARFGPEARIREWSDLVEKLLAKAERTESHGMEAALRKAEIGALIALQAGRRTVSGFAASVQRRLSK
jgi:hypothetical protein